MPGFPFPGRPGGEHDEPLLDMLIARRVLPPDAPREMHDLARMLAALAGPAEPDELAAEAAVRAAFSRAASPVGVSSAARRPVRHRRTRRSRRLAPRARLATVLVVAAAGLGSVLAAYADVLPSPIQQLAHTTVAAPAPGRSGPTGAAASGPGQTTGRGSRADKSQPSSPPPHSAAPVQSSASSAQSPRTRSTPPYSPSAVRPSPGSTCSASSWPPRGQSQKGPDHGSPGSPWSQPVHCASVPTPQPTAQPTVQPTQYGYPYTP
jgi:hypothetical protein